MYKRIIIIPAIIILLYLYITFISYPFISYHIKSCNDLLTRYIEFKPIEIVFYRSGLKYSPPVYCRLPSGFKRSGSEVKINLYLYNSSSFKADIKYRVVLYCRDGNCLITVFDKLLNGCKVSILGQYINGTRIRLPDLHGEKLYVVVEALRDGIVVDYIMSNITLVSHVDAELYFDKEVYKVGDKLRYTIVNTGIEPIIFGVNYTIYRWNRSTWIVDERLTPKCWIDILYVLYPNSSKTLSISLDNAEPGRYKIVKDVEGEYSGIKCLLEAEFKIIEG